MDVIDVIDGGFLTTVQDLGRYGYQRYGVPVSGAMDLFALRAANLLVGNRQPVAGLEITLQGPRLRFLADAVIAVAGADLEATLDEHPLQLWRPIAVPEGAVLGFGSARDGVRAYLAIAGGIDVPVVLGSRSTFVRGGLGGFKGRPVQRGDRIAVCGDSLQIVEARTFPLNQVPAYGNDHTVRVILGPQDDAFTEAGIAAFLSATYVVTSKSDRIGCRLEGPRVRHERGADIVSDGVPFGAIQVAADGVPIVLAADRGTTGGYTKIATVISVDLTRVAQALPGCRLSFRATSVDAAHRAVQEQEIMLERVARSAPVTFARRTLEVSVDDRRYTVATGLMKQRAVAGPNHRIRSKVQAVRTGGPAMMRVEVADSPSIAATSSPSRAEGQSGAAPSSEAPAG